MYLLFKKWAFETRHCGKYVFEYSREHRQQRWYLSVMDKKTKVMITKNLFDDVIDESNVCLFDAFLMEAVPALEKFIMEMPNGETETVQSEAEA